MYIHLFTRSTERGSIAGSALQQRQVCTHLCLHSLNISSTNFIGPSFLPGSLCVLCVTAFGHAL